MRANTVVQTPPAWPRPAAPTGEPAPRTLLPIGQRSRLAADIAAGAGVLLPHPFTPHRAGARRDCSLLPSCVAAPLPVPRPRLRFRGVAFRGAPGGRSGRRGVHAHSAGRRVGRRPPGEESGSSSGGSLQRRPATSRCPSRTGARAVFNSRGRAPVGARPLVMMEPVVGVEPTTCCLRNSCSATELHRPAKQRPYYSIAFRLAQQAEGVTHDTASGQILCLYVLSLWFQPAAARNATIHSIGRFPALWAGNLPMEKEGKFYSAEGYAALHMGLLSQAVMRTFSAEAVLRMMHDA